MAAPRPVTVLVLVGGGLIALYLLGVGLGQTGGTSLGQSLVSREGRERLRERLFETPPVTPGELQTECPLGNDGVLRVPLTGSCRVDVMAARARLRSLELVPLAGSKVSLRFESRSRPSVPVTLSGMNEPRALDVHREGASLSVTCVQATVVAPSVCALHLR